MDARLEPSWEAALAGELRAPYFTTLSRAVGEQYARTTVYPPAPRLFSALNLCPLPAVRVVILGQDPYHGPGQANGLAFSVADGIPLPPSLRNIYREVAADTGRPAPASGNLERWAHQGVLLLNTYLSVEAGKPASHQRLGWERFTDAVISTVSRERTHVAFLLWGRAAAAKAALVDSSKHLVLAAPHPSPLSAHRGFFGCRHFSSANEYLTAHDHPPIVW